MHCVSAQAGHHGREALMWGSKIHVSLGQQRNMLRRNGVYMHTHTGPSSLKMLSLTELAAQ